MAGQASVSTPSSALTVINQSSSKAIINWQDFSVASGSTVQFNQPDSASLTLNRVVGNNLSAIDGAIKANGQVWLINPNGVLFGQGATINLGGLLATTADIANADFLSGNYAFKGSPSGSAVVNQGVINAATGGSVVLSAAKVVNKGVIIANSGHVVLGGADSFTVDFKGDGLLSYAITAPAKGADAGVSNEGVIKAPGGRVLLTARAADRIADGVVNNSGMIEATSAHAENGEIVLDAGDGGAVNSGTLDASGKNTGETGGTVKVLGKSVTVADASVIDASGDAGGGTAIVGGDLHGAGPDPNAQTVTVGKATIKADAITSGNGGTVAVYSTGTTKVAAAFSARGGAQSGDGGTVETSGHTLQVDNATTVTTLAPHGSVGDWLLDPGTICIATSVCPSSGFVSLDSSNDYTLNDDQSTNNTVTIAPSTITSALEGGSNVTLQASSAINVKNDINYTSANSLTLLSKGGITINANVQNSGAGNITVTAGWDGYAQSDGMAAAGTFGNNYGSISIQGNNVAVGSKGGNTYFNAYQLLITSGSGSNTYAQAGYHGTGGGNIGVQTLAGGVYVNDGNGNTVQLGNGGYDNSITSAVTGDITITTTGTTTMGSTGGNDRIGNYAGSAARSGNVSLTTGTLVSPSSSTVAYDINKLIDDNIGITNSIAGGDVSVKLTAASGTTSIAQSFNSPHNVSVISNNDLAIGTIAYNGGGNLTLGSTAGSINVNGAMTSSSSGRLSLLANGTINVNASVQNSGAGDIVLVQGWDGASFPTGLAAAGTYALTGGSNAINIKVGNVAVGSAAGNTYISAYDLELGDTSNSNYAQVGYHGAGGGNIAIQILGGNVNAHESYGGSGTVQIGNGGYDNNITGAATGNITITDVAGSLANTGLVTVTNTNGIAAIGNYAGAFGESGNVGITAVNYMASGTSPFLISNLIGNNIGSSAGTGGDVSIKLSGAVGAITIAGNYTGASPHNITVATNNGLTLGPIVYNGTGIATLSAGTNINITGNFSSSATNQIILAAQGSIAISNASFQNSGAGSITLVAGWDGTTALSTGLAASGSYGLNNGGISITGNGAVGSAAGSTFLSGYQLALQDGSSTSYAQVGYHGAGGGAIGIQTLAGGITMTEAYGNGGTVQIGNGGYDGAGGSSISAVTGNITINTPGSITVAAASSSLTSNVGIGNFGKSGIESGNVTLTVGGLSSTGAATYNFGALVTNNIGTSVSTGGDVSLTVTAATAALTIATLSYASPHNVTISTNNALTLGPITYNGTGNLTLTAGTNINVTGNLSSSAANQLIVAAKGSIAINNASIQDSGAGSITLVAGWDGTTTLSTGLAASGTYGLNSGGITVTGASGGNAAVGSSSGATYLSGYGLSLQDSGNGHYAQVGYHGAGGGDISVQTAAGGITLNELSGGVIQLGNGGYDGTITGKATGAISFTSTGNLSYSTSANTNYSPTSTVGLGNYAGSNGEAGNISGTVADLVGGITYFTPNVGTSATTGGDVSLTLTSSVSAITLSALNLNSPHNITITTAGSLALSTDGNGKSYTNTGTGSTNFTTGTGDITASGAVTLGGALSLTATGGAVTLTNTANAIAGTISLTSKNNASLYNSVNTLLGTSNAGGNSTYAGALNIQSGGSLTINSGATLTAKSNAANTAVTLVAATGFINNAGAGALIMPDGGSFRIYSQDSTLDSFNSLNSNNTAIFGATYSANATYTGNRYIFANKQTLTVTAAALTKTYGIEDSGVVASDYTITGAGITGVANAFLGDTSPSYTGTPTVISSGSAATANAGTYSISFAAGNFAASSNYNVVYQSGTLTVNPAVLTISLQGTASKTYDGSTGATLSAANYALSGLQNSETVTVANTSASYADANAGTGKTVTVNGLTLTSANAGNYTIASSVVGAIGTITQKAVTVTLQGTVTKTYDGTTTASLTSGNTTLINGLLTGDAVTVTNISGISFADANAGTGKTVTATSFTLSGAQAGNYTVLSSASAAIGTITPKALTVSLQGTTSKVYDGSTAAVLTSANYTALSGVISGDAVTLTSVLAGNYADANAGTGKTVTVTGLALGGAKAANYTLVSSVSGAIGTITQKPLTVALQGTVSKAYDGTTTATLTSANYAALSGVVGSDAVTLTSLPTQGAYDSADIGTAKTVTVTGLTLAGAKASDYTLASSIAGAVGVITAAASTGPSNTQIVNVTVATTILQSPVTNLVSSQTPTPPAATGTPAAPNTTPPPPATTQASTGPIGTLVADNSGSGSGSSGNTDPPPAADQASDFLAQGVSGTTAGQTSSTVVIPGLLGASIHPPGNPPPDNSPGWGNSSLWQ